MVGSLVAAFVLGSAVGGTHLHAEESCSITYERKAISAYDRLDSCITGTNYMSWYERLYQRSFCNAEYIADALGAATELGSCVSVGSFFK
jgi:hypothetical protein